MARRRTRRTRRRKAPSPFERFAALAFGAMVLGAVCISLLGLLLQELALHPVASLLLVLAVVGGAIGVAVYKVREHQRQAAMDAWHQQHEAARLAHERYLWELRAQAVESYHQMGPAEFEKALAFLCERDGCSSVEVVGKAGDLGADVIATTPHGTRLVIQAKRYTKGNAVKGPDLQKFGGTCYAIHAADIAAVVTTSDFTKQARMYAAQLGIKLYDGHTLAAWASQTGPPPWVAA